MTNTKDAPQLYMDVLDETMRMDLPIAVYIKTIRAKLGVVVFNPITRKPEERILQGDPQDPKTNLDSITVRIWDDAAHTYFRNVNKALLEDGRLAVYNKLSAEDVKMINAITSEEIDEILNQPYFTLMNRLNDFTSPIPVERILHRAIELNKGIKTIDNIKAKLSELQMNEGLVSQQEDKLRDYYQHLE